MNSEIFKRIEKKYLLTEKQYHSLLKEVEDHLEKDKYFKSTICNVYFDTDNYDLIVESIEKPTFKLKVRLRSYNIPNLNDKVFLEIKNKYKGIVGKRRVKITLEEFYNYLERGIYPNCNKQIMNEIDYLFKKYNLKPKQYIAYDRESYYDKENKNFRITFDQNLRSRKEDLNLEYGDAGKLHFKDNTYIMELKTLDSLPLWFTKVINKLKIYPTSFSKYGKIYIKNKKEEQYV